MEISRKLDYAVRMLSEVTRVDGGRIVSVRSVSEHSGIPYAFARTIQHDLVKVGLLTTVRGPQGGMRLAVDASGITLLDIAELIEGSVCSVGEARIDDETSDPVPSELDPLWQQLSTLMRDYLASVTLEQLAIDGLVPHVPGGIVYSLTPMVEPAEDKEQCA